MFADLCRDLFGKKQARQQVIDATAAPRAREQVEVLLMIVHIFTPELESD
jgi:hypothetical protein